MLGQVFRWPLDSSGEEAKMEEMQELATDEGHTKEVESV